MPNDKDEQMTFDDLDRVEPDQKKRARKRKTAKILEEIQEKIIDVEFSDVMRKSYIDYSMSVITARALPDVRDGLKPVQRRIIYDMQELGTTSDKPYRKVARVVGDTMGKYHPHGDSSLEGALVVMAQDWKQMEPLVDGHGNFGSIEGDEAAASRYIECRLTKYAEDVLLSDIKENTIDLVPNYDEELTEPSVLPCKLPHLLINGSEGIAVGMATSMPTHNTAEVIDAAIWYLDHEKDATIDGIMEILPGPDFPTGGIVSNKADLKEIYATGSGRIKVRGKVEVEQEKGGKERLVITEIPYPMIGDGIGKFLQAVADLVENKTLTEIVDISNQSSKEGIRIVLDLRKGADTEQIENILYKKTRLEDTFGCNFLAISNGRPETMSILDIYREYAAFQYEIHTRLFENLLKKADRRREIDEGLLKAIDVVDTIVEVLRGSRTVAQARECLMTGNIEGIRFKTEEARVQAQTLRFTEVQAQSILELRLARLVGLEIEQIQEDYDKIVKNINRYKKLLGSRSAMRSEIKKELEGLKAKYGRPRKTLITDAKEIVIKEKPEEILPVWVLIDRFHYMRAVSEQIFDKNKDQLEGENKYVFHTQTDQRLIAFTDTGKAHTIKVRDIPYGRLKDKGTPIDNISGHDSKTENIIQILPLDPEQELVFVSSDGYVKRVSMQEFDVTRRTIDSTKLSPGATVVYVAPYDSKRTLMLTSANRYGIRFQQEEIPVQGKVARGAIGLKLEEGDHIEEVSDNGLIHLSKRGGKGKKR